MYFEWDTGICSEPSCPNEWCATQHSIRWSGPAKHGYWTAPNFQQYPFEPKKVVCEDNDPRCSQWAKWETNECQTNPAFMLTNCKKSCNACTGSATTTSSSHGMEL